MIGYFFDALVILTAILGLFTLALRGYLTTEQTAVFLFVFVIGVAITRAFGVRLGRLLRRIGLPLLSLYIFAIIYSHGRMGQMLGIIGEIVGLLIVLMGLYIMIVGPFGRGRR